MTIPPLVPRWRILPSLPFITRLFAVLVLAGLLGWTPRPAPAAGSPPTAPGWVALSYVDLLDPEAIIRDGRNLKQALAAAPPGYLQPFLDGYSSLLPYALEMISGPDEREQRNIVERYPPGTAAPAWAAILRAGKILLTSDGRGKARIFLPGDDPAAAWRQSYSVIRHPLATLLPADGSPLTVEVLAYRNDYRRAELRLRLRRHTVTRSAFPAAGTTPDLAALEDFFREGGQFEGVRLSPEEGLVFYARPGPRQVLANSPVSLADLAVAYRAAVHAGENKAFVSLDPHRDPTLSTVNFGGYLEDTGIGQVVLDADRRFKTITCGLDPETFQDLRAQTRRKIPAFMTGTERIFLSEPSAETRQWVDTRYWFYADSVGIDADPAQGIAVITRPYFTADAERKGGGHVGKSRRGALSWKDQETIKHLNANYGLYARTFPEIDQLATVARLLAVAASLKELKQDWLDLDALLAVELPAFKTPRELTKMLTMCYLTLRADEKIDARAVTRNLRIQHLSPVLDLTIEELFVSPTGLTGFLRRLRKAAAADPALVEREAAGLFETSPTKKVREMIRSEEDLSNLVEYLGAKVREHTAPEAEKEIIRQLKAREAEVRSLMEEAEEPRRAAYAKELAEIRADEAAIGQRYHGMGKGIQVLIRYSMQEMGGIDLQPDHFTIRRTVTSPALARFKELTAKPGLLIKGRAGAVPPPSVRLGMVKPQTVKPPAVAPPAAAPHPSTRKSPPSTESVKAPAPIAIKAAAEREEEGPALPAIPALKKITVREGQAGGAGTAVIGEMVESGRIVFTRLPR